MVQAARVEHQIKSRWRLIVDDVTLVKLNVDTGLLGARPCGGESGSDEVDRDDGESLLREVHGVHAFATAKVESASACRPLRDRPLEQRRRMLTMPRQRLDTRRAPVQPGEHRPLETHAGTLTGSAPRGCMVLSLRDVT